MKRTMTRALWRISARSRKARLRSITAEAQLLGEAVDRTAADRDRLRAVLTEALALFDATGTQVSQPDPDTVLRWRQALEAGHQGG